MAIYETYSRRQKLLNRKMADVFIFDDLPSKLRVQIARLWSEAIDGVFSPAEPPYWVFPGFHSMITTELGIFHFGPHDRKTAGDIINYFMSTEFEEALDIMEMMFAGLIRVGRNGVDEFQRKSAERVICNAIDELNQRLLQHGVGYTMLDGDNPQIIRRDSEHLHSEVVLPALMLLSEEGFEGANDEYRKAHKHYRDGNEKECLNECLKAFESVIKIICARRGWSYQETDTAKTLIDICLRNGLLPPFMQSHLGTVRSGLESAIPTIRNKMSGHGQGKEVIAVPPFYAEYLLHETATSIVFLVDAFKALP
jgi:hypothetical protein